MVASVRRLRTEITNASNFTKKQKAAIALHTSWVVRNRYPLWWEWDDATAARWNVCSFDFVLPMSGPGQRYFNDTVLIMPLIQNHFVRLLEKSGCADYMIEFERKYKLKTIEEISAPGTVPVIRTVREIVTTEDQSPIFRLRFAARISKSLLILSMQANDLVNEVPRILGVSEFKPL